MAKRVRSQHEKSVDAIVGRNIKRIRLLRKMSQSQLGAELDRTFQQVQKYEAGKDCLPSCLMPRLCRALSVGPVRIFEGALDNVDLLPMQNMTATALRIANSISKLRPRAVNGLREFLDGI